MVANQPHDEEVNLSDGDESSPEVCSHSQALSPSPLCTANQLCVVWKGATLIP